MAKTLSVGCALLLIGLSQISLAVGETHLECIRNRIDFLYGEYNWYYGFDFLWNYAATADTLPSIFQGKLNGTGIYCANAVDDPRYVYLFIRDDERLPALTPAYLYVKYYFHATNASNVNLSARPAKGMDGLTYYLPTNDKFRWEEQLIEIDIEAVTQNGYWIGIRADNMRNGQYLLVDTIALIQGEVLNTAAEAGSLCPEVPASLPVPRHPKINPSLRR